MAGGRKYEHPSTEQTTTTQTAVGLVYASVKIIRQQERERLNAEV
jgi:hypothetical protein